MAIARQAEEYPVRWMCKLLGVQPSSFYAWRTRCRRPKNHRRQTLVTQIRAAHRASRGTYGSPRIYHQLKAEGVRVSRRNVAALMRAEGISGDRKRRFVRTTRSNHGMPVAENLLARDFSAEAPNRKWVTDITYISTEEGWVYLASIMDLFSRRIVGWAMDDNMEVGLTLTALQRAVESRKPQPGLIHHSDRGSQYASTAYQKALKDCGMMCSMSRKAECWDNAVAESVFGRLKEELIYRHKWESKSGAIRAVDAYLSSYYNHQRLHSSLDFVSPAAYEMKHACRQLVR